LSRRIVEVATAETIVLFSCTHHLADGRGVAKEVQLQSACLRGLFQMNANIILPHIKRAAQRLSDAAFAMVSVRNGR